VKHEKFHQLVQAPSNQAYRLHLIISFWRWQQHNRHYGTQGRRCRPTMKDDKLPPPNKPSR